MSPRLPANKNLILHTDESYRGLHIYTEKGPSIQNYLEQAYRLLESVIGQYRSVYAFRFDLCFPKTNDAWPSDIISTFVDSVKAQIKAYLYRNQIEYQHCSPKFMWVKERYQSTNNHYHLVLFLNGDVFSCKDSSNETNWSLRRCIEQAWLSQLNKHSGLLEVKGLVEFPANDYLCIRHSPEFLQILSNLFYRISYFTKAITKKYEDGSRHFSTSKAFDLPSGYLLEDLMALHRYQYAHIDHRSFLYSDFSRKYMLGGRHGVF